MVPLGLINDAINRYLDSQEDPLMTIRLYEILADFYKK